MFSSQKTFRKRRPWGFLLLLFLAALIFCAVPAPAVGATKLKAELVHKTEEGECISYSTGQVQLVFPDGHTQILPYRSHLQPVVADGKVYIFTTKGPKITRIVVYDSAKRKEKSFPVPKDFKFPYFGQPSFSPDGTKVAYYFFSGESSSKPKFSLVDRIGKRVKEPMVSGKSEYRPETVEPPEVLIHFCEGQKAGFKDLNGKVVIPPQFDEAEDFSEGLAPVRIGRKWGFIDKTGKIVIPPKYYRARGFSEGLAAVNIGGKLGYGKCGFIDKAGKMVIPAQYDRALSFSEGLAGVSIDGKYGFIDQTGKMIIQPQYDDVEDFSQGVARVGYMKGSWRVRVRSWPDWKLLWQSPLCSPWPTDVPPLPPLWESKSLVEFDPLFFDPPRFLKYRGPEPGKTDEAKPKE